MVCRANGFCCEPSQQHASDTFSGGLKGVSREIYPKIIDSANQLVIISANNEARGVLLIVHVGPSMNARNKVGRPTHWQLTLLRVPYEVSNCVSITQPSGGTVASSRSGSTQAGLLLRVHYAAIMRDRCIVRQHPDRQLLLLISQRSHLQRCIVYCCCRHA